jgi:UDPglucose 6-dehydrogenase
VAVVGLGKLGLPLAGIFAARGCHVSGFDTQTSVVEALSRGKGRDHEPLVEDLLEKAGDRLSASTEYAAVGSTEAAFVVVPTASDPDDRFSLFHVLPAVRAITCEVAEAGIPHYTIVLVSTVMPGACEGVILPAIEEVLVGGRQESSVAESIRSRSARTTAREPRIELVYAPEFVALGNVVRGMLEPDLILVGGQTEAAAERVATFLESIVISQPTVVRTNLINAEIAKLALNALVSTKVTCANLLSQICQRMPGADVDTVTQAVGADPRIGPKYLRGGLGYGGPCFPRDVRALSALCVELGLDAALPDSVTAINEGIPAQVAAFIHRCHEGRGTIGVLGLAYRPGTNIVEASQPVEIVRRLVCATTPVLVYDPLVQADECPRLADMPVTWSADVQAVCKNADTIVITGRAEEFRALNPAWLAGKTIVDCWRWLSAETVAEWLSPSGPPGFRYFAWGCGAMKGERGTDANVAPEERSTVEA